MNVRIAIITVVILGAVICLRAEPSAPTSEAALVNLLIASLQQTIVPPKGTHRADVDAVFGEPREEKELKGKGSSASYPMHIYQLLPASKRQEFRSFLCVTYRDDIIRFAGINHYAVANNRDVQPSPQELARENRRVLIDLLEIQDKFSEQLKKASWNKCSFLGTGE